MESSSVSDRVLNLLLDTVFSWLEVACGVDWYSLRHPVFIGVHTLWNAWGWGKGGVGEYKGQLEKEKWLILHVVPFIAKIGLNVHISGQNRCLVKLL